MGKYKKPNHNSGHDDLLNCNIGRKKHTAILHLRHRDFHMRICRKILRANGCFDPEWKLRTLLKQTYKTQKI